MIKVSTAGSQKIKNRLRQFIAEREPKNKITIGIHEEEGGRPDGELSNAELGAAHHFGTDIVPARPWLDVGVSQDLKKYSETISTGLESGQHPDEIAEAVGGLAASAAQVYMTDLRDPPNTPETIKRKGGKDNPLIKDGELRGSITYKVHGKNDSTE
ncbi:hypothetical protein [Sessilibacter corallicola]|uniref:hypothetical protein n=1 Tax=Sessilibacter corallicola TaxID=2904075 RepID=UPI001E65DDC5|nr:hypothetical protein [Sessilibacter corallicola]MCE2029288.1 hypothetical protein [Sessilibacter corallicola]